MRGLIFSLTFAFSFYAAASQPADSSSRYSMREARDMYIHARNMLNEEIYTDVSPVPRLLQAAVSAHYGPAQTLLLDVWEGRFKGLPAQPEKAFAFALEVASLKAQELDLEQKMARADAMFRLAFYHEKGRGCALSPTEAFRWMQNAADEYYAPAEVELARYYISGLGAPKDYVQALRLLKSVSERAAETPHLYFYLGYMAEKGLGIKRPSWRNAHRFYREGALRGDARATNNLARMYERGMGVVRNESLALRLYRSASRQGSKDASVNALRLSDQLGKGEGSENSLNLRVNRAAQVVLRTMPQQLPLMGTVQSWLRKREQWLKAQQ